MRHLPQLLNFRWISDGFVSVTSGPPLEHFNNDFYHIISTAQSLWKQPVKIFASVRWQCISQGSSRGKKWPKCLATPRPPLATGCGPSKRKAGSRRCREATERRRSQPGATAVTGACAETARYDPWRNQDAFWQKLFSAHGVQYAGQTGAHV